MPTSKKYDILIVGGGVAGLSTAYYLAKAGQKNIAVLEQEKVLGGHASGRNAGMIRQAIEDPVLAKLALHGRKLLSRQQWPISFVSNGSLLLGSTDEAELNRTSKTLSRLGVRYCWMSEQEAVRKVSILQGSWFGRALFCPSDAFVDIDALLRSFLTELQQFEVPVYRGVEINAVTKSGNHFCIETSSKNILECKRIVNAAGAWALPLAKIAGASPIPLDAYRRHIFTSQTLGSAVRKWPFVWDVSRGFYFRPVGQSLLLSACDKQRVDVNDLAARHEKVEPEAKSILRNKMDSFSDSFRNVRLVKAKSGLRTMAPDGRFVIGEDPKLKNFYWVAGLGGHGVTTCLSVGELAANLILGKKVDRHLEKVLSPCRFQNERDPFILESSEIHAS